MKKWIALAVLIVGGAIAYAQTPPVHTVNTPVGWIWTYFGPTIGADWGPPATGICPTITGSGGIGDGATDNTNAFNAAIQQNPANPCIQIPAGQFVFNSALSISMSSQANGVSIIGAGPGVTSLIWASPGNGLSIQQSNIKQSINLANFSVLTKQNGTGVGISISGPPTSTVAGPNSSIQNVVFRGFDGPYQTNFWTTALAITSISNVSLVNVSIFGGTSFSGDGISILGTASANATVINLISSNIQCTNHGLIYGTHVQGVTVSGGSNFVCGNIGIWAPAGIAGTDQLTVIGNSFNQNVAGILFEGAINATAIESNVFIPGNNTVANAKGIDIETNMLASITHNNFQAGTTGTIGLKAVNGSGVIEGNQCIFIATCINLSGGSWHVTNDNYYGGGVGTGLVNTGPGNTIDAVVPWTPTLVGASTPGGPTYTTNTGVINQSGAYVDVLFQLTGTSLGGAAGNMEVHGLPKTNFSGIDGVCVVTGGGPHVAAGVGSAQFLQISGLLDPSSNVIKLFLGADATSGSLIPLTNTQLNATFNMFGKCSFISG